LKNQNQLLNQLLDLDNLDKVKLLILGISGFTPRVPAHGEPTDPGYIPLRR